MLQHMHTAWRCDASSSSQRSAGSLKLCAIYDIRTNDLMAQCISRGRRSPRLLVGLVDRPRLLSTWRAQKGIIAIESAIWAAYCMCSSRDEDK